MLNVVEKARITCVNTEVKKGGSGYIQKHKTFTKNILPHITSYLSKFLPQSYNI